MAALPKAPMKSGAVLAGGKAKQSFAVPAGGLDPPIPGQSRSPIPRYQGADEVRRPHAGELGSPIPRYQGADEVRRPRAGELGSPIPR